MNKFERLLFILNLIRSNRSLNAKDLANRCDVTERTIYRDITALSSANIPIYYDDGYKLLTDSFLPALNIGVDEFQALLDALSSTPIGTEPAQKKALDSLAVKIESKLSPRVREKTLLPFEENTVGRIERLESKTSDEHCRLLDRAIRARVVVKMTYESVSSGLTRREVEPLFRVHVRSHFYCICYCRLRQAYRTFRISRIKAITLTDIRFKPHQQITPEKYFESSWSVFHGEPIKVRIIFRGRSARVVRLGTHVHNEKLITHGENELEYRAEVAGIEEIGRWLLGLGGEVTILEPRELRDWVRVKARGLLNANDLTQSRSVPS